MTRSQIEQDYFDWMCSIVGDSRHNDDHSYRELLSYLHQIEFVYVIKRDANRAEDGISLRYRYSYENGIDDVNIPGPCSVFEMILALAIRCEEDIMDDPSYGNRIKQWFWKMINNLGLSGMTNSRFDYGYVDDVIFKFLNRDYSPDGRGGLFTVKNCEYDLRDVEIWTQMLYYLDSMA